MGEPRIAAFARMANGTAGPERVIWGQKSKVVRYSHGVLYDPAHDETFASEPSTSAILVFRGGANGEEAPIRVIQGSKTRLHGPWQMALDLKHDELYTADFMGDTILVFPRDANGNVAPVRAIDGRKSGMFRPAGVAVDADRNLVVVATVVRKSGEHPEPGGLYVFNRNDNGNVEARAVIKGPRTGIHAAWHVALYQGHIFAAVPNTMWRPVYDLGGFACRPGVTKPSPWVWTHPLGFVGVWRETDNGDVPPRGIIRGGDSGLYSPFGLSLNPEEGEVLVTDQRNQIYSFVVPQLFTPDL